MKFEEYETLKTKLGLSHKDMAILIGINQHSICKARLSGEFGCRVSRKLEEFIKSSNVRWFHYRMNTKDFRIKDRLNLYDRLVEMDNDK